MFKEFPPNVSFPELEQQVLAWWEERDVYAQSLQQRRDCPKFVFFEGPPTANGMPHPGHCLTRSIKDLFPRYRTMRGYYCERKAGWDTHGLPVETEVCKELGIHSKEEIEAFGVEPFIHKCQQSVWRYMQEWEALTQRLGFWVDLSDAYVTYHQSYVESVWWSLKNLFDRGLLYQGHKIVWWWSQGGTALSAGEVGQGYRDVADPSVYVRFPWVEDPNTALLVWTTTPWTLPSNQFAAVHQDLEYATVAIEGEEKKLVIAADLVESLAEKFQVTLTVVDKCQGSKLVGKRYIPPFDDYYSKLGDHQATLTEGGSQHVAWRVVHADFVSIESGTGAVHEAPAFGEVDFALLQNEQQRFANDGGPQMICAIGPDGKFTEEVPQFQGQWVKDADKPITRALRERGLLVHQEQYLHSYPFCWRADEDPLIQYPRRSWFVRTTEYKDAMVANNQKIQWQPEHIRDGRFGNFLDNNVDWALSRERYWGTPLPIWVCERTGHMEAVGSYDELLAKPGVQGTDVWQQAQKANPNLPDDLKIHKPYIDAVTYDSPQDPSARMRRVPEVIDCWFDSGAMPFAQWGYRDNAAQGAIQQFKDQFPADFISEAIDQTRGWFYSLVAISTLMFSDPDNANSPTRSNLPHADFPHPFKNCIVLGLMLGEDGQKMSKSKRNYREPNEIFDKYGADALRWYFFANQAPWTSIRYNERAIKDSIPEFLLRLWHVYSFFAIYANIDEFDPAMHLAGDVEALTASALAKSHAYVPIEERSELDRWILSELHLTLERTIAAMDAYDNHTACAQLNAFVDALSNWFVRRSRERYWGSDKNDPAKRNAYWTLYECLITLTKAIAPFTPFLAETLWQSLTSQFQGRATESVHWVDYPDPDPTVIDQSLSERMRILREIASLGRSARMNAKLKVRQPLAQVEVILAESTHQAWLQEHNALLCHELNVKEVQYTQEADQYITFDVIPNFKLLGPRVGKLMPSVKKALSEINGGELLRQLTLEGTVSLPVKGGTVELSKEDIEVRLKAKDGWAAAQGEKCVVVLSTELTQELIAEGYARDLVRFVQERRKQLNCDFTDRIAIGIVAEADDVQTAVQSHTDFIRSETLAKQIDLLPLIGVDAIEVQVAGKPIKLFVKRLGPV